MTRRLGYSLLLFFLATSAIFIILQLTPGSPYERYTRELAERNPRGLAMIPESQWTRYAALYGLDKPVLQRYGLWLKNVLRGDFGSTWSVSAGTPVYAVIGRRLPYTLVLMLCATVFSVLVAVPLGIFSAAHQYENSDFLITLGSYFGLAMPAFWFGYMLIALVSLGLDWLPLGGVASRELMDKGDITALIGRIVTLGGANPKVAGYEWRILVDGIQHLILPTITVSLVFIARWLRMTRSSVLEVLGQDFVRTARAKGLPERLVMLKHVLRNSLIPLVTVVALDIPAMLTGLFIVENVFSWPGLGRLFIDGLRGADWPLLQGLLMVNALLIIVANLCTDVLYGIIDPRVRVAPR